MRLKYRILAIVVPLVLVLDQWTKHLIHSRYRLGETWDLFPSIFAFTYVRNQGAAFSLLNDAPAYFRDPFFLIVPLVALLAISYLYSRLRDSQRVVAFGLSLVAGGAIGNLIDRLRYGYVVDFIDWHWKEVYHWPRFNIADSCIVVGVALLLIDSWRKGSEKTA
jgi:lipoprotein signal peptidase